VVIALDSRKYFVKKHEDLDKWISYDISSDPYSQSLVGLLDPKKDNLVLDDGCGNGRFSIAMAMRGARVVALDINRLMLKVVAKSATQKKLINYLDLVLGDIQNLPFKESVFDRLLCAHNLWYVPNYQVAVSEMFRTLKAGGRVVADHLNILNQLIFQVYCYYLLRKILKQNPNPFFPRTPKEILLPFASFITEAYSLSVSNNETTVDVGGKTWTRRLIIRCSKRGSSHIEH